MTIFESWHACTRSWSTHTTNSASNYLQRNKEISTNFFQKRLVWFFPGVKKNKRKNLQLNSMKKRLAKTCKRILSRRRKKLTSMKTIHLRSWSSKISQLSHSLETTRTHSIGQLCPFQRDCSVAKPKSITKISMQLLIKCSSRSTSWLVNS